MNIRASPCKGLSKLTEEVNALKLKKNLFVPKPKLFELNVANSTANRSVTHNTHGDEDVIKQSIVFPKVSPVDLVLKNVPMEKMLGKEVMVSLTLMMKIMWW